MSEQSNESRREAAMPHLSYELSLIVAFATGAEPNYCYANAWHAILELPLLQDARLVEGWLLLEQPTQISVTEHCWCEFPDGLIIDPSLVLLIRRSQPVLYFSGIQRARSEVEKLTCRDLPYVRSVGIYGPDGMGHADYRAAYHAAYEQARMRVAASSPSKSLIVQPVVLPPVESDTEKLAVKIGSSRTFLRSWDEQRGL